MIYMYNALTLFAHGIDSIGQGRGCPSYLQQATQATRWTLKLTAHRAHRRGSASAAEPPGCSSPSLSLLDAMAAALLLLLLLAPERLSFSTGPDDRATNR